LCYYYNPSKNKNQEVFAGLIRNLKNISKNKSTLRGFSGGALICSRGKIL
jgi:hypothetical protein